MTPTFIANLREAFERRQGRLIERDMRRGEAVAARRGAINREASLRAIRTALVIARRQGGEQFSGQDLLEALNMIGYVVRKAP